MDELCPLCLKTGTNSRIKAMQINLEKAVWMCENEECLWSYFAPDGPTFFPRKVGEKRGYGWETYRRVKEHIGSIPVSIELSLYTPPVTPSADASTKDSAQSEIAINTLESSSNIDVFSSSSSSRDSYAPRYAAEAVFSSHEKVSTTKEFSNAKIVPIQYEKDSKVADTVPPSLPSIFDIDGDEYSNKISVKLSPDSGSTDLLKRDVAVLGAENSDTTNDRIDAVLATFPKSRIEKTPEIKEENIGTTESSNSSAKGLPQIRSIARTNIDLQRFDPAIITKIEKPETFNKLEHSTRPTERKSQEDFADRLFSPKQQTTTITVDGIPNVTLSYDLTDFVVQTEGNLPATSAPIPRKECPAVLPDNGHDKELSAEIPKKKLRQSVVRRAPNRGKAFEKFSFSALKKVGKSLSTTNASPAFKNETPILEKIINCNQSCTYEDDSHFPARVIGASVATTTAANCETVNPSQRVETLNSVHLEVNNSIVTESPMVDSLNLSSLLDDMLLDGYQNVTQDINDDWLESFFETT